MAAAPVVGAGLKLALPLFWTLPCTSMTAALTEALPLAETALDELESTTIAPGILRLALPESERAPPADGSRMKTEGATVTVKVCTRSQAVTPPAIGSVAVTVTVYVPAGRTHAIGR